jgi:HAD superfamily hydrolase (TIGR01509 family)
VSIFVCDRYICAMQLETVIFDIDGLLVDSEPLWNEAAAETFLHYEVKLTDEQYQTTTGLRTKEFLQWWLTYFKIAETELPIAEKKIIRLVLEKIAQKATIMPGVPYIFDFFARRDFKIGLATSSPPALIELVMDMAGIRSYVQAATSAEDLLLGKPHPQVYLNCAAALETKPVNCVCFEDSFNGMIAAKSARMKCVVVPHGSQIKNERWGAADLKLSSLQNFGELHFNMLNA